MKIFVRDLQPNQMCRSTFLVNTKEVRQKKTGEPFLSLNLGDKTGDIETKMWDNVAEVVETFAAGDFIKVKGVMSLYNGRPQFTLHTLEYQSDADVTLGDFFATSARDAGEMYAELSGIIEGIGNVHLRSLLQAFFADESLRQRYMKAPAAKQIHHAYLSGLIEHVLSLCNLCKLVAPRYPMVDLDLLLTGAILHDIGKVEELTYDRGLGYSSIGQLIGHISIGARLLHEKLRLVPDFPGPLAVLVEHMILSHHGKLEFGSPKIPLLPEALLLHYLDDMDSKMEAMRVQLERDERSEGVFTSYNYALERAALKRDRFLGVEPVAEATPETPAAVQPSLLSSERAGLRSSETGVAASSRPSQSRPQPAAAGARSNRQPAFESSLFGDKLLGALGDKS